MPPAAGPARRANPANLAIDPGRRTRRPSGDDGIERRHRVQAFALAEPADSKREIVYGLADDVALRLAQPRRGLPERLDRCLVERERYFDHIITISGDHGGGEHAGEPRPLESLGGNAPVRLGGAVAVRDTSSIKTATGDLEAHDCGNLWVPFLCGCDFGPPLVSVP